MYLGRSTMTIINANNKTETYNTYYNSNIEGNKTININPVQKFELPDVMLSKS